MSVYRRCLDKRGQYKFQNLSHLWVKINLFHVFLFLYLVFSLLFLALLNKFICELWNIQWAILLVFDVKNVFDTFLFISTPFILFDSVKLFFSHYIPYEHSTINDFIFMDISGMNWTLNVARGIEMEERITCRLPLHGRETSTFEPGEIYCYLFRLLWM